MEDIDEALERFKDLLFSLNERELLSYWIQGEYDEARIYWELAEKAEELNLPSRLISTFQKLARDSEAHGNSLRRIYAKNYNEEPKRVDLPYIEGAVLSKAFEGPDNLPKIFEVVMETELVAMELYQHLASMAENEEARKLYQYLANVEKTHYERLRSEAELMGFSVEQHGIKVKVRV